MLNVENVCDLVIEDKMEELQDGGGLEFGEGSVDYLGC